MRIEPGRLSRIFPVAFLVLAAGCGREPESNTTHEIEARPSPREQETRNEDASAPSALRVRTVDPVALATAAPLDMKAARDLGGVLNLCEGISSMRAKSAALPVEWRELAQSCTQLEGSLQRARAVELRPPAHPDMQVLAHLASLEDDDPLRERGLIELLRGSESIDVRMGAALSFLTEPRLAEWSAGEVLPVERLSEAQVAISQLYGCRIGLDCSGGNLTSLGECALTPRCQPGTPLADVVALRWSPEKMLVIKRAVDRLVQASNS